MLPGLHGQQAEQGIKIGGLHVQGIRSCAPVSRTGAVLIP